MKQLIAQTLSMTAGILALIFAMGMVTLGVLSWTDANAAVENTRHNLGTSGTIAGQNQFDGTADVCVFCHTPHGGAAGGVAVPLWNRDLGPLGPYTTYATLNSATLEGAEAPVGSVSIACLSCHDGTQAMDTLLNDPGSGLVNSTFSTGTWSGANQTAGQISGLATNLGTNLANDHPIGIQYGGGGITETTPTAATNDPDFTDSANGLSNADLNGTQVWWVNTDGNTTREKTDMLLYSRDIGNGLEPFVECATCHDPHTDVTPTFLRTSNDGSAVCLACHDK